MEGADQFEVSKAVGGLHIAVRLCACSGNEALSLADAPAACVVKAQFLFSAIVVNELDWGGDG